ncbi:MAG: hypothetical protein NT036_02430 [Candidatus Omnitrophica bacterium]|nr:hypothetical protein [Candidatus Omnitrophota bacterium]
MNRAKLFKAANVLLAISFLVQVITVIGMVFFKGILRQLGISGIFFEIHEQNGFIFVALVLVHLFFNWGWVKVNILKRK